MTRRAFFALLFAPTVASAEVGPEQYALAFGTLSRDSTGGAFNVGQSLALFPREDSVADQRLKQFDGCGVSILLRPERSK